MTTSSTGALHAASSPVPTSTIPPIPPFPARRIRDKLSEDDWAVSVQYWVAVLSRCLRLDDIGFKQTAVDSTQLQRFLASYVQEHADASVRPAPGSAQLRKLSFGLIQRILTSPAGVPESLLTFSFVSDACIVYSKSQSFSASLETTWQSCSLATNPSFVEHRKSLDRSGRGPASVTAADEGLIRRMAAVLRACPSYGAFLLSGSSFLDWIMTTWPAASLEIQSKLGTISFLAFRDLLEGPVPNSSSVLDHLFDLQIRAQQGNTTVAYLFLSYLASSTPFVLTLNNSLPESSKTRARSVLEYLSQLRDADPARKRPVHKGKQAVRAANTAGAAEELHVHQLSAISQIQDLFPNLGAGFVARLLDAYNDDTEQVTAHLLEDSLPANLANADRSEPLGNPSAPAEIPVDLNPRSTPPLAPRRNIHDGDDFDRLVVGAEKLHIGKKERQFSTSSTVDKARIYSSLAAFDLDDDERDDTYDVQDVGGSVDVQGYDKDRDEARAEKTDETLYRAWKQAESTFSRDRSARQSAARQALRTKVDMTDEAIEGWALMLQRNPKRQAALEAKFSEFSGQQTDLRSSKWKAPDGDDNDDDDGEDGGSGGNAQAGGGRASDRGNRGAGRGGGRGRGRGRGRGGGGSGGDVSGPASEKGTQQARQRKDENKASRANHNRRAGRAKKLAKVGLPG